jgi:hypothetical protein
MQTTRDNLVAALRHAGLFDEAERAEQLLPDSGDFDEMVKPLEAHGISRDMLIDRLGGSP